MSSPNQFEPGNHNFQEAPEANERIREALASDAFVAATLADTDNWILKRASDGTVVEREEPQGDKHE